MPSWGDRRGSARVHGVTDMPQPARGDGAAGSWSGRPDGGFAAAPTVDQLPEGGLVQGVVPGPGETSPCS
jgi:hypothetical protein